MSCTGNGCSTTNDCGCNSCCSTVITKQGEQGERGPIGPAGPENILTAEAELDQIAINALFNDPVQIVAAPGVGKYIEVLSALVDYSFGAIFFNIGNLLIQTKTATIAQRTLDIFDNATESTRRHTGEVITAAATGTQMPENQRIEIASDGVMLGTGGLASTAKISITYRVLNI